MEGGRNAGSEEDTESWPLTSLHNVVWGPLLLSPLMLKKGHLKPVFGVFLTYPATRPPQNLKSLKWELNGINELA